MNKLTELSHQKDITNTKTTMKKTDKKNLLHEEILSYFNSNKYIIKSAINTITSKSQPISYVCKCQEEKVKTYKDMLRRECRTCKNNKHSETPTDYSVCPSNNSDEKWIALEGGFISNLGNAINFSGKELTLDEKGRYYINGKLQYVTILMAKAFKIPGYDKLDGQKCNYIVRNKSELLKPTLNDIYIGTRNEIGKESGVKSHKSISFQESIKKDIIYQIENVPYKKIPELPDHLIFEDGNIYINGEIKRFLCFSTSISKNDSKTYKYFCSNEKTYKVHRLVCMAFHPLKDKINYDDYEELQVNHKDGNTHNNHSSNLEWNTQSQNMTHAYETGLNKKVRAVFQFKNENGKFGELINEFVSLAEASRKTSIPDYEIREICKGKGNILNKKFLWKYKNEEENDFWTKKFSSCNLRENNSSSGTIIFDDDEE